jgi:hypothetical protein
MDLISLVIGIALGAAFSPFWIKFYGLLKELVLGIIAKFKK